MYRILVVDDEPLVVLGVTTLLGKMPGAVVCDTASNGKEALEKIKRHSPHIVITDIKMPIMDGLELIGECKKRYGHNLAFIVLTSYEEFSLIREAISYQVVDYMVKIGLNQDELVASVNKAIERLKAYHAFHYAKDNPYLQDRFYLNLLNQQLPETSIARQARELDIDLDCRYFAAAYGSLTRENAGENRLDKDKLDNLYFACIRMMENILKQYARTKIISLDSSWFVILFMMDEENTAGASENIQEGLADMVELLESYFSVKAGVGVGSVVESASALHLSYQEARMVQKEGGPGQIIHYREYLEQIKNRDKTQFYHSILAYIDQHIREPISVKHVAEAFAISPNYLSSSFKSHFGVSFVEYVNRKKIEKAKETLLSSNLKIYEVAEQLGFENTYYFSKVFRKIEGMSPREFIAAKLSK